MRFRFFCFVCVSFVSALAFAGEEMNPLENLENLFEIEYEYHTDQTSNYEFDPIDLPVDPEDLLISFPLIIKLTHVDTGETVCFVVANNHVHFGRGTTFQVNGSEGQVDMVSYRFDWRDVESSQGPEVHVLDLRELSVFDLHDGLGPLRDQTVDEYGYQMLVDLAEELGKASYRSPSDECFNRGLTIVKDVCGLLIADDALTSYFHVARIYFDFLSTEDHCD